MSQNESPTPQDFKADVTFRHDGGRGWVIVNGVDLSDYIRREGISISMDGHRPRVVLDVMPGDGLEVALKDAKVEIRQSVQDSAA